MGSVLEVKSHHVAIVQVLANNNYKLQQQQQFLLELSTPLFFHLLIVCLKYLAYYKRQARNFGSV